MNPYYHQTIQNYYTSLQHSFPDLRGWIYDPITSTGSTLDCFFLFNPQPPLEYVDDVAILNTPLHTYDHHQPLQHSYTHIPHLPNPYAWDPLPSLYHHPLHPISLDNPFDRIEQEGSLVFGEITLNSTTTTTTAASGLSEETITQRLQASVAAQEKTKDEEETDVCAICLDGYDGFKKMGRLECGHGYHVDCIKTWLLHKNVCPMCKATAFTI